MATYKVYVYAIVRVDFDAEGTSCREAAEKIILDPATHQRLHEIKGDDYSYSGEWLEEAEVDQVDEHGKWVIIDNQGVTEIVDITGIYPPRRPP
jgi:hypothetical protein